jgi:hypothetical protein
MHIYIKILNYITKAPFLDADIFGRQLFGSAHFVETYGGICNIICDII